MAFMKRATESRTTWYLLKDHPNNKDHSISKSDKPSTNHVEVEGIKRCFIATGAPFFSPSKGQRVEDMCTLLATDIPTGNRDPYVSRSTKIIREYSKLEHV